MRNLFYLIEQGTELRLRFQPSAAWRVQDYFHPKQITRESDSHLLVNCNFPEEGTELRLRFQPSAAWRVQDYFHPKQITRESDSHLLVNCNFPEDQWLLSFLLSFGSQLEVLSPGYWRDILVREGKKFLEVYET